MNSAGMWMRWPRRLPADERLDARIEPPPSSSTIGWKWSWSSSRSSAPRRARASSLPRGRDVHEAGCEDLARPRRPAAFAAYIATSAFRSRSSAVSPPGRSGRRRCSRADGPCACSPSSIGRPKRLERGAGDDHRLGLVATSSSRTANSSPPSRAAVSPAGAIAATRAAAATRTRVAAAWPNRSLSVLKLSRSMNSTATGPRSPAARPRASTRSWSRTRFARPVSPSRSAWGGSRRRGGRCRG